MYMPKVDNEPAERQRSLEWTAASELHDRLVCQPQLFTAGIKTILLGLDTIESTLTTDGARAYLETQSVTVEEITQELTNKLERMLRAAWRRLESKDSTKIGRAQHVLLPFVSDNWEPDGQGGWRVPRWVERSRSLLTDSGVLTKEMMYSWNVRVAGRMKQPRVGMFIGLQPIESPEATVGRVWKAVQIERQIEHDTDGIYEVTFEILLEAAVALAYCNSDSRCRDAVTATGVEVLADIVDYTKSRLGLI
jgi:hypothetical protein